MNPVLSISTAQAAAPATGRQTPGFYRTKVGDIEITALLDGGTVFSDELMIEAKKETLDAARANSFLPVGASFPGYVNAFLINTQGRLVLVDTGAGRMGPNTGNIFSNLKAAGVTPDMIDEIILTHAHPDHTGGLLDDEAMRVFPKAPIRLARQEMDFWFSDTAARKYPQKGELFASAKRTLGAYRNSGQIDTFSLGGDLGRGLSSIALPGHTPGHSGIRISDGKEQFVIWADIVHVPALQFENPAVSIAFDTDPDQARATRLKIFDELATDKIRFSGMHLVFPAVGHVTKRGDGYDFTPQFWETTL